MQQRSRVQSFEFRPLHAQLFCDLDRVNSNALQMLVRGVVLGFDGKRQRLDRAQVQVRHFLNVTLLILQLAEVKTIRAINEINRRHHQ